MPKTDASRIAILYERIAGVETALTLQAKEYARRLDELNHAHQQAVDRYEQFTPREMWTIRNREIDDWRRRVDAEMSEARGSGRGVLVMLPIIIAAISLIISLVIAVRALG